MGVITRRRSVRSLKLLVSTAIALAIAWSPGRPAILDERAHHELLKNIAPDLDRYGIDVIQSWSSPVESRGKALVAPLADYRTSLAAKEEEFAQAFASGDVGAIAALKGARSYQPRGFEKEWASAP